MSAAQMKWLLVTLVAPMASFGETPGNARRGSAARPTKSALLGLLGAALGVRRDDADAQAALAGGYRVATRTRSEGAPVRDFHTYQSLPSSRASPPRTRAEALARRNDLATSISVRDYRADIAYEAAFSAEPEARWPLETLAEALRRPVFTLYLGRKSCPLSWPLDPTIVTTDGIEEAFATRDSRLAEIEKKLGRRLPRTLRRQAKLLAVERDEPLRQSNDAPRRELRRDQPGDRVRWHFSDRVELVVPISQEEAPE